MTDTKTDTKMNHSTRTWRPPALTRRLLANRLESASATITISTTAFDDDSDLAFHALRILTPDIAGHSYLTGNWDYSTATSWVDVSQSGNPSNPFRYFYPKDDTNQRNPPSRTFSFVLDAEGWWEFQAVAKDDMGHESARTTGNSLRIWVNNIPVTTESTIPNPSGRLVGAYFNAGQPHRDYYLQNMWRPASGRWDYSWGPNPVAPLARSLPNAATDLLNPILGMDYLGWSALNSRIGRTVWNETGIASGMAAELHYAGVDFVVIDHTNLVFTYANGKEIDEFTNTDNCVTRAATSLVNGFEAYANSGTARPRIKIAFMLGLTTAWYMPGMPGSNPSLELAPASWPQPNHQPDLVYTQSQVDEYISKRVDNFNAVLQTIWNSYASLGSAAWQDDNDPDPTKRNPLLFLYVGTDGPAFLRDRDTGTLKSDAFDINNPLCLKVRTGGQSSPYRPINEVFTIKYVASGMATGNAADSTLRDKVSEEKTVSAVTSRFYKNSWSFREINRNYPLVGTQNGISTDPIEAVHIAAYRDDGEATFADKLTKAVSLKPRFLMLAAWNEFGSASDEPSPSASWTIMPNNKYGRRYTEILRTKVIDYKAAAP